MKSLVTLILLGVLLGGGFYYAYSHFTAPAPVAVQAASVAQVTEQAAAQPAVQQPAPPKTLPEVISNFSKNLDARTLEYKKRRNEILELVNTENLGNPEYMQKNLPTADTLIPELQNKMDEIMAEFKKSEDEVRAIIATQPENEEKIMNEWRAVRDKQGAYFRAFFASEQLVLQGYQELMQFYIERQGAYVYDSTTKGLLFHNPADKPLEQALRDKVKGLESDQEDAMRKAAEHNEPEPIPTEVESAIPEATMQ